MALITTVVVVITIAIILRAGIARLPTYIASTGYPVATNTATATTTAAAAAAEVALAPPTPARHKAVHQPPQHTPTVPRPLQTHSQRHRKKGATQAFRCPRRNRPSPPGAHTTARCGTDSGTGEATTSRWTSTSCTLRTTVRTRESSRATRRRRRVIKTTMEISSSMIQRGVNCLKVCRGRGSRLCYPMIRLVVPPLF